MDEEEPSMEILFGKINERKGEEWVLKDIMITMDITNIVNDIRNGAAIDVSDGSFKDKFGTASWVLENV